MTTARETEERIEFGVWVPGLCNYMALEKSLNLLEPHSVHACGGPLS